LAATCDPCVASVCAVEPSCCTSAWDVSCVGVVATVCGDAGSGSGLGICESAPNAGTCSHSPCTVGELLPGGASDACDPCTYRVCADLPLCCTQTWDAACVAYVSQVCEFGCP
jgi:hypothetical protein